MFLRSETITFSDATLSDINVVLWYVLSQYPFCGGSGNEWEGGGVGLEH
jgi:hypothetical protein